jgi:hypothetical protein
VAEPRGFLGIQTNCVPSACPTSDEWFRQTTGNQPTDFISWPHLAGANERLGIEPGVLQQPLAPTIQGARVTHSRHGRVRQSSSCFAARNPCMATARAAMTRYYRAYDICLSVPVELTASGSVAAPTPEPSSTGLLTRQLNAPWPRATAGHLMPFERQHRRPDLGGPDRAQAVRPQSGWHTGGYWKWSGSARKASPRATRWCGL